MLFSPFKIQSKRPEWWNWQTRRTQNPVVLGTVRVQAPPPAINQRSADSFQLTAARNNSIPKKLKLCLISFKNSSQRSCINEDNVASVDVAGERLLRPLQVFFGVYAEPVVLGRQDLDLVAVLEDPQLFQ